jgi:hypothetical protein
VERLLDKIDLSGQYNKAIKSASKFGHTLIIELFKNHKRKSKDVLKNKIKDIENECNVYNNLIDINNLCKTINAMFKDSIKVSGNPFEKILCNLDDSEILAMFKDKVSDA